MIKKGTVLLFTLCVAWGVMWGAVDGQKLIAPGLVRPDTSGPDPWGYTWVRSTDPGGPAFQWVDITTRGTLVTGLGDDNFVGPFNIPFNFPYYWYTVNRFRIGSNGYIDFDNAAQAFSAPFAQLPNATAPNNLIAACVGDLVLSGQAGAGGQCYYWGNNDSLVVSWINVTEWEQTIIPTNTHTFQIVLTRLDSTIKFQYGLQRGRYNTTNNTRLCIGIENATGQIGLNYTYSTTPPHALMPDSGLAIKIKRTVNTGLQVTDAGVVGGLNALNQARVIRTGVGDTIKAVVKNFGTVGLTNVRVIYIITRALQPTAIDTVFVPAMTPQQEVTVIFPRLFTPAVVGSYNARFEVFVPNDVGPGNNVKIAELFSASFAVGQSTRLQFENGTVGGSINWIGGGGVGMAFDLPQQAYPVRIETVYVHVSAITANPMLVQIVADSSGVPGPLLRERSVTAVTGFNTINFTPDSIRITGGKFYVGGRGQMAFSYETSPPISYRSWEYTGGWAPYRSADLQDVIIRVTVRPYTPTSVEEGAVPQQFALLQNYPNPFNPKTSITYTLPKSSLVTLRVYDLLGQEVATLKNEVQAVGLQNVAWNGTNNAGQQVGSGVYVYRLEARPSDGSAPFTSIKKMVLLK